MILFSVKCCALFSIGYLVTCVLSFKGAQDQDIGCFTSHHFVFIMIMHISDCKVAASEQIQQQSGRQSDGSLLHARDHLAVWPSWEARGARGPSHGLRVQHRYPGWLDVTPTVRAGRWRWNVGTYAQGHRTEAHQEWQKSDWFSWHALNSRWQKHLNAGLVMSR